MYFLIEELLGLDYTWHLKQNETLDKRDQGKNPKLRVSSYFHSSFSPISSHCGGSNSAGQLSTLN